MRTPNHQRYLDYQYFSRLDRQHYGTPTPEPVALLPIDHARVNRKLQEQDAVINTLENRVNGLMKMGHTHSKKVNKYNTYSLD